MSSSRHSASLYLELEFSVPPEPFGAPKYSEAECRELDMTYSAPLNIRAKLLIKETGEIIEKTIFMGDFPLMTKQGTFIINGSERVVVSRLGRYKLNKRLDLDPSTADRTLTPRDLVAIVKKLIEANNSVDSESGPIREDDIDHLGNRRVRSVGELLQNQFRIGLLRMERVGKERMTIQDPGSATPGALINIRPVVASIKEFFGGSQLSQFMDQTNPLAELTHKRRLSALGPGGLSRDRAGFDVRDVHHSHYGRICPIETPEGPTIGLIGSPATYGRPNAYGFIETPYRRVLRSLAPADARLVGQTLAEDVAAGSAGE